MQGHTSATATYRWNEPVFTLNGPMSHNGHAYRADSYRCHDFKAETPQNTITAGAALRLAWTLEAAHPGDWCASLCSLSALSLTPAKHNLTLPSHVRSSLYISYPSNDAEVR